MHEIEITKISNDLEKTDFAATNAVSDYFDCELEPPSSGMNVSVSSGIDLSHESYNSVSSSQCPVSLAISKPKMVPCNDESHHSIDSSLSNAYLAEINNFQKESDLPQEKLRAISCYHKHSLSPNLFGANENSR